MSELPQLQPRSPDSHKGDYGRVLLVGGQSAIAETVLAETELYTP